MSKRGVREGERKSDWLKDKKRGIQRDSACISRNIQREQGRVCEKERESWRKSVSERGRERKKEKKGEERKKERKKGEGKR